MALSRAAIVAAGLNILDTYGLGDLSMRRVADALGVQAGALYYHVPNKQSLLAALSDEILAAVQVPEPDGDLASWLTAWAGSLRGALLARRDGAELVASSLALGLGVLQPTAPGHVALRAAAAPNPEATMATLLHFVLGHVVEEQTKTQMHALGVLAHFDVDSVGPRFDWGVGLIVGGVEAIRAHRAEGD